MNAFFWVVQIGLALLAFAGGSYKVLQVQQRDLSSVTMTSPSAFLNAHRSPVGVLAILILSLSWLAAGCLIRARGREERVPGALMSAMGFRQP